MIIRPRGLDKNSIVYDVAGSTLKPFILFYLGNPISEVKTRKYYTLRLDRIPM